MSDATEVQKLEDYLQHKFWAEVLSMATRGALFIGLLYLSAFFVGASVTLLPEGAQVDGFLVISVAWFVWNGWIAFFSPLSSWIKKKANQLVGVESPPEFLCDDD